MTDRTAMARFFDVAATLSVAAAAAVGAGVWLQVSSNPDPPTCTSAKCTIPIKVDSWFGLALRCNLVLNPDTEIPKTVTEIEWVLPAGYSFVSGVNAVPMLNFPGDFVLGTTSTTVFTIQRAGMPPVSKREYKYNVNVQSTSSSGQYCIFPTLPRIKNE